MLQGILTVYALENFSRTIRHYYVKGNYQLGVVVAFNSLKN